MAWKYCNGNFSQQDKGRRPRGSSRTLNVYIQRHMRDRTRMDTRRRRVSVSPRENVDWNYVKRRIFYSLCWRGFTVLRSRAADSKVANALTHACHRYFHWFFPTKILRACDRPILSFPLSRWRQHVRIESKRSLLPRREKRSCTSLPYLCSTWEAAADPQSYFPAALSSYCICMIDGL